MKRIVGCLVVPLILALLPLMPDAGAQGGTCDGMAVTIDMNTNGGNGVGTNGPDVIKGTSGADFIDGRGGNDRVCGGGGNDTIIGGDGNDRLFGEGGRDIVRGNTGNDLVDGGPGADRLLGGIGNDRLVGGNGNDYLGGFGGDDTIIGGPGNETIYGGFGADTIDGGDGNDVIRGLIGNDVINGGEGDDELHGDRGSDTIDGGPGADEIGGGNAGDLLRGGSGNDIIGGGRADDTIDGGSGHDLCYGNLGNDTTTRCESGNPPTNPPAPTSPPVSPSPTATTNPPPSSGRFETLPVGAALPSGAQCAQRVRSAPEIRPENATANANRGGRAYANNRPDWSGFDRVDGNFSGTTDEIIQWAACKWGIDEDIVRAQVIKESYWRQSANGDNGESWGLGQVRDTYHQSAFEFSAVNARNSSAYNLDYTYASWRACFEGVYTWLNDVERNGTYSAGDVWGCMGVWFAGRWYVNTNDYLYQAGDSVQFHYQNRTWEQQWFIDA